MAKRSKQEMIAGFRNIVGDRTDDSILSYLEDISDSMELPGTDGVSINPDEYVGREEYASLQAANEELKNQNEMLRQSYINRFYGNGSDTESRYIMGATEESTLINEEKRISYDDLFE